MEVYVYTRGIEAVINMFSHLFYIKVNVFPSPMALGHTSD